MAADGRRWTPRSELWEMPLPLASRWKSTDPSAWSLVELNAVDALTPTDAWAVGYSKKTPDDYSAKTFVEHWDGSTWARS